jgi:HEAT repeat protein
VAARFPRRHTGATVSAAGLILAGVSLLAALARSGDDAGAAAAADPARGFAWPGADEVDARQLVADLASIDRMRRRRAVERLALRDDAAARAALLPALADPDAQIRVTAARVLARAGVRAALDAAAAWTTAAAPSERRLGLEVMREWPGAFPDGARRAIERSLSDDDAMVRLLAIDALAREPATAPTGAPPPALPSFLAIATATEDEAREVRLRATRLLAESGDPRAAMPLLARLGDADRQVRITAIQGLGAAGDARAAAALERQLGDPADDVRIAAADALGRLRAADAVPALGALLRRRPADDVAREAALALGEIGGGAAMGALVERLREAPALEQVAAGLRRIGRPAIPALLDEAAEGTPAGSAAAAALLGDLVAHPIAAGDRPDGRAARRDEDRRVERALAAIVDRRGAAAAAAIGALGAIGDPDAVPALMRATADATPELRRLAYAALAAVGDDRALPRLPRGLADGDPQVRVLALRLGGALGARTPALLAALPGLLGDSDAGVRAEALRLLLAAPGPVPNVVPALLALLERTPASAPPEVEAAVADALEAQAGPGDDAALTSAASRVDARGRAAIARALAAAHTDEPLAYAPAIDLLVGQLGDGGDAAEAAADALGTARLPGGRAAAVLRAFEDAEPSVRARLCGALAALAEGRAARDNDGPAAAARLARAIGDPAELPDVRAAAAWAAGRAWRLPGADGALAEALRRAAFAADPALAANARAALTPVDVDLKGARRRAWAGVRLLDADGAPIARRWVVLAAREGTGVWAKTGVAGTARVSGLPPGPYDVMLGDRDLVLRPAAAGAAPAP